MLPASALYISDYHNGTISMKDRCVHVTGARHWCTARCPTQSIAYRVYIVCDVQPLREERSYACVLGALPNTQHDVSLD